MAVGFYGAVTAHGVRQRTLIEHWDAAWTQIPSPNAGSGDCVLTGVSAVAADDVWTVGYTSRAATGEAAELVIGNAQRTGVARDDIEVGDVTRLVGGCTMMPGSDTAQQRRMLQLVLDGLRPTAARS